MYTPEKRARSTSIAGKARAAKLSPQRRHDIAMMGAKASMKKGGYEYLDGKQDVYGKDVRRLVEQNEKAHEAAAELLFDPPGWVRRFLRNPETGEAFELYPEQEQFLREAFTPDRQTFKLKYDEIIFSAPKKRGKTTTAAIALLYVIGVLGDARAEGYVASNSREQSADRVFADCSAILKASPELVEFANIRNDAIEFPATQAFIKTVTTEAASAAGGRPTMIVFDELWGFQNKAAQRLWDELVTTPTTRISVRFTVTYAGFVGESTLLEGLYHRMFDEHGVPHPDVEQLGKDLYRRGRMLVYWSHDVRPPWITDEWIETQRLSYSPNQFARIMENRWVSAESSFIEAEIYKRCVDSQLRPSQTNKAMRVWVGIDASLRRDSTAIVAVALDMKEETETSNFLDNLRQRDAIANPIVEIAAALPWKEDQVEQKAPLSLSSLRLKVVWHRIVVPEGRTVDFSKIEQAVLLLQRSFDLAAVAFDPYQLMSVAQGLTRYGVTMVELPQTPANTMGFSSLLRDLIEQQRIRIYPSKDLQEHVLAAASKESQRGWHIVKAGGTVKIDAAVALAEACFIAARFCAPSEVFLRSPNLENVYGI